MVEELNNLHNALCFKSEVFMFLCKKKQNPMENKYFTLSSVENNRFIKLIQIIFGIACFAIALYWISFNIKSIKADKSMWITIVFLSGFGFYMIWAGLGKAVRFIEMGSDTIRIKKTILLPASEFSAGEIQKIEIYPFSIRFFIGSKKNILRLSSTWYETNANIKDEILNFADNNGIQIKFIEEEL